MSTLPSLARQSVRRVLASPWCHTATYFAMILAAAALFALIRQYGLTLEAPTPAAASAAAAPRSGGDSVNAIAQLLLSLSVLITAGRLLARCFRSVGQPAVIGEVIAGIMLGPSVLGRISPGASTYLLPAGSGSALAAVGQLGVILYIFLVGMKLNGDLARSHVRSTVAISHASIVVPFLLGAGLALYLYPRLSTSDVAFTNFALFLGTAMSITAFPVLARILSDLRLDNTKLGVVALACASADDVTAWQLLAISTAIVQTDPSRAVVTLLLTMTYGAAMFFLVKPLLATLSKAATDPISQESVAAVIVAVLVSALMTELIGVHALFGAFLLGVAVPNDSPLARRLATTIEDPVMILLLPAFFASTGMRTRIDLVTGPAEWLLCGIIVLVATVGKVGGTVLAARVTGMPRQEALSLGVLMNTRGLMELIVLNIGLELNLISPLLFTMLVLMAVATTMATTPLLKLCRLRLARPDLAPAPTQTPTPAT